MKTTCAVLCAIIIFIPFTILPSKLFADDHQRSGAVLPFDVIRDAGLPYVHVLLNGSYPAVFLIDTGADQSLVSEKVASDLSLRQQPAFFGGARETMGNYALNAAYFQTISLGVVTMKNYPLVVIPQLSMFTYPEFRVDGIIGEDVLSRFALSFDFPRRSVTFYGGGNLSLEDLKSIGMDNAAQLKMRPYPDYAPPPYCDWQVDVVVRNGDRTVTDTLTVDTGSPDTSISRGRADRLNIEPFDRTGAETMQDKLDLGDRLRVTELDISTVALKDWDIGSLGSKQTGIPPLLGEDVYADGKVIFDFPARKFYFLPTMPPADGSAPVLEAGAVDKNKLVEASMSYLFGNEGMAKPDSGNIDDSDPDGHIALLKAKITGADLSSDAKNYGKIGDALYDDRRLDDAKRAYEQGIALLRQIVSTKPNDADAAADLAVALTDDGQVDEGVQAAQDATKKFPDKSAPFRALGYALHAKSLLVLTGSPRSPEVRDDYVDLELLVNRLHSSPPPSSVIGMSSKLADQARSAFNTAVKLAPDDAVAYHARADFENDDAFGRKYVLDQALKSEKGGDDFVSPDSYTDDEDAAALLKPAKIDDVVNALDNDFQHIEIADEDVLDHNPGRLWASIPRRHLKAIEDKMTILKELSETTADNHVSAEATSELAYVATEYQQDNDSAVRLYKAALVQDPTDGSAILGVSKLMSQNIQYDALLAILKDAVAKKDSALARFEIARADDRMGYWQDAQDSLAAGLALKPDSFSLNLAMADQLLALLTTDNTAKAKLYLDKASAAIGNYPHTERRADLEIALAIYQTETGDVAGARHRMINLLDWFPTSTRAREVIAAGTFPAQAS